MVEGLPHSFFSRFCRPLLCPCLGCMKNTHFYLFKEKFIAWINNKLIVRRPLFLQKYFLSEPGLISGSLLSLWMTKRKDWDRLGARAFCPKTLHSTRKCITVTSQTFWHHKALTSIKKSIRDKMSFKKALKTLEILEKPEVIFNRRLNSNPFHPFKMVGKNSKYFIKYHFRALTWRVIIFAILRGNSRGSFSL